MFIADGTGNNRIRKVSIGGIITTVAGNGSNGYSGDNHSATAAALSQPTGVAVDSLGNLFIADGGNYRVRKVSTNGSSQLWLAAGNNTPAMAGQLRMQTWKVLMGKLLIVLSWTPLAISF